ncbi:MAG TPA: DUF6314 family protein [Paenirhodobacter sp.]
MALDLMDFEGEWGLARRIFQQTQAVHFTGRAVFRADGDGLHYHEQGLLHLPGATPLRAERDYLWRRSGDRIAIFFADGRPFHDFSPGDPACQAVHWCDPDDYHVRYAFHLWPEWRAEWRVRGPRKDYRMISRYTPLRDGASAGNLHR